MQFGASRNVVREVLRRREAQRLIEVAPRGGGRSSGSTRPPRWPSARCSTPSTARRW
ncbi:hypothetical protein [Nonomuraea composti]|uniref:hypothetical protein n=1 Tax=Nonomuraea composti TaxID=2720023 RepID=UPI003D185653